jgi:hypothetical protein
VLFPQLFFSDQKRSHRGMLMAIVFVFSLSSCHKDPGHSSVHGADGHQHSDHAQSNHGAQGSSAEPTASDSVESHSANYTCPMHPEIRQAEPGTCPICHMKLVKSRKDRNHQSPLAQGVLDISPYQAELIGLDPIYAQREEVELSIPVYGTLHANQLLALQVFERDLRNIRVGLPFSGQSEAFPEVSLVGQVTQMDRTLDPSTRTLRVLVKLDSAPILKQLPMESSVTGYLKSSLGTPMTLPEEAIFFSGKGSFVYIYEEQKLRPRAVTLGPRVGESYVILQGLSEEEAVSPGPNFLLDSEAKIRGLND